MSEMYFSLTAAEQTELLDTTSSRSGRPAHLLEKDVWVATERIQNSFADTSWLEQVVRHKAMFFQEKDQAGAPIDYRECLNGHLCLVPEGGARETLREDYNSMIQDGILLAEAPEFDVVLEQCLHLQLKINSL